jgi:hypothetical protein
MCSCTKIDEVKREDDILLVRVKDHYGCYLNFRVDFKNKVIQYKDGTTFNGWWKDFEKNTFIGEIENENKDEKAN